MRNRKVALVHDFLLYYGGAEGVLKRIADLYPDAPIYTLIANEKFTKKYFPKRKIEQSFLSKFPGFLKKRHRFLLPLMPTAPETFNLREYGLVISSSSAFSKGVVVKPGTIHVCYKHAPMRYVWDWNHEYLEKSKMKGRPKLLARFLLNYLRTWDRASADRVDYFIANSVFTAQRIKKYYRRDAKVIYPPVEVDKLKPSKEHQNYFLAVGRLSPYKRMDLLAEVFSKLKLQLKIVGDGKDRKKIEKIAKKSGNIEVLGWVDDQKLVELYQGARAFLNPAEDDFNIASVEAMAAGKPVIAVAKGGSLETVIEGETGLFFEQARPEMVADAVRRFLETEDSFDCDRIRKQAERFSVGRFEKEFQGYLQEILNIERKN